MIQNYILRPLFVLLLCAVVGQLRAQTLITVAEGDNAGEYYSLDATFGPFVTQSITALTITLDDDDETDGSTSNGCTAATNDLEGAIALVDRGGCAFTLKSIQAQEAGAIAVIICNSDNTFIRPIGDDGGLLTIPTIAVPASTCTALRTTANTVATLNVGDNLYCARATPIAPGTYTVDSLYQDPVLGSSNGAGPSEEDANVTAAKWYAFTPESDGIMTVNSCFGGADTRLLIHTGNCNTLDAPATALTLEALNDDACPFEDGNSNLWASRAARYVTAGKTYYLEWNNRWMEANEGFTFGLEFQPLPYQPESGESACTASFITPGTYTIELLEGFGAIQPNGFASEWYSFTADTEQIATISSCGTTANTLVNLYTGDDCEQLVLAQRNNDGREGCAPASEIVNFPVQPGTTYYIEWSDVLDASGFSWTLAFDDIPDIPVTFIVDMAEETVSEDGVFLVYASTTATTADELNVLELSEDGDGVYVGTTAISAFDSTSYNFTNGTPDIITFSNIESVPDDCSILNPLGFNSRVVQLTSLEQTTLSKVCYASCVTCKLEDCSEPLVLVRDNFDDYTLGALGPQSSNWTTWSGTEGGTEDGIISTEQANSGGQAIKIEGATEGGPQDVIVQLGDKTAGHYYISWDMYVPADKGAYFNMQHLAQVGAEFAWQITMDSDGKGVLDAARANAASFSYPQAEWFKVILVIDQSNDIATLNIAGNYVHTWTFSALRDAEGGTNQISSIDFYPLDATQLWYIDNFLYQQIPDASEGEYCVTALTATEGVNIVTGNRSCFGGHLNVAASSPSAGAGAVWYAYTPTTDGVLTVSSCGSDSDSRLWIVQGGCTDYVIVGANDDQCTQSSGDPYASLRELVVKGGEQYYIVWDNRWDVNDFSFELVFEAGTGVAGQFPQTAIPITAGSYDIASINGNSTIGNEVLNSVENSSLTLYGQSKWYAYTPTMDEIISISSCAGASNDNIVVVHTGELGTLTSLDQIALDDNGCSNNVSAEVTDLIVTSGQTYLIEWIILRAANDAPFTWTLSTQSAPVSVTFNVDATLENISPDGIHIAGSFSANELQPMTDNGEGLWSATVALQAGSVVSYNFYNGNTRATKESVDGDCINNDTGERLLTIGESDTVLELVCFGACSECPTGFASLDPTLDAAIELFPNPAKDEAIVRFALAEHRDLNIKLVNALGQVLQNNIVTRATSGFVTLKLTDLPTGAYTVVVTDNDRLARRVLIID